MEACMQQHVHKTETVCSKMMKLEVAVNACNLSTRDEEAERSGIQSQPSALRYTASLYKAQLYETPLAPSLMWPAVNLNKVLLSNLTIA